MHHEKTNCQHIHFTIEQDRNDPVLPAGLVYLLIGVPMIVLGNDKIRIIGIVYWAMPILLAVIGFICFAIFAALYNLIAKWVGGMEFEMIDVP